MFIKVAASALAAAGFIQAGGGKPATPTAAAPNLAEIRIASQVVPAGGTAQIQFAFTNPEPILSGGSGFRMEALGVALSSTAGDAAGVAVYRDGLLHISAFSPLGDLGMQEYPFLMVTTQVPQNLANGTVLPLDLTPDTSLVTSGGPLTVVVKPGTLAVGGSFWIHGVTPGGGTYPAGTTIRIDGQGFVPNAQLRTPQMKVSSWRVVSPTEIDFVLKEQTTLDGQPIQVTAGNATQTYYSYLRGVPIAAPSRDLLKKTDPIFQLQTHAIAQAGPFTAGISGQYQALALQNPNPGPAVATVNLTRSDGTVLSAMIVLPSGGRMVDDVAALVQAGSLQPGDRLSLNATSPIQILGLTVDENAGTVIPYLPVFF